MHSQTAKHVLQNYANCENNETNYWPNESTQKIKLYSSVQDLEENNSPVTGIRRK